MPDWNAVITVQEKGYRKALDAFAEFGVVKRTEFFNVLLMRAQDMPLMLEQLRERHEADPGALSYLARLVPADHTFSFSSPEEFNAKASEVILGWTPKLAGQSFHVRIRRRGFRGRIKSPDEEKRLDELVLDELQKRGLEPARIDFGNPDTIIAVETVGTWAGFSLWMREQRERYPFIRV